MIHLSDALLAPLGLLLKTLFRVPVVVTVHGLDITFDNAFYQWMVPRCLRHMDQLICVSSYTRDQCLRRGVPAASVRRHPQRRQYERVRLQLLGSRRGDGAARGRAPRLRRPQSRC